MNKCEQASSLSSMIDGAFADVVWPAPENLVAHPQPRPSLVTFRDLEEPSIRSHFGGKRQGTVTDVNSETIEELLSMTGPAVKYYLPCFLKGVLVDPGFGTVTSFIRFLDIEKSASQGFTWPQFTDEQKAAVVQFIEYMMRHIRSYDLGEFEDEYAKLLQKVRLQWKRSAVQ